MENFELGALVAVVIGVTEAVKRARVLNNRYVPLVAVALGIAGALYFGGASWLSVASGVLVALSSSGLYSGVKRTVLNK